MRFPLCALFLLAALASGEEPKPLDADLKIPKPEALGAPATPLHAGSDIIAIAWSPDGQKIAACTEGRSVVIWSASTGEQLSTWRDEVLDMKSLAWSPDGELIAAGATNEAVAWKVDGHERVQDIRHEGGRVRIAFIPGTRNLVTAVNGGGLKITECDGTGTTRSLKIPTEIVNAIAVSGDGKRVAIAGMHPQLAVLSFLTGDVLATRRDTETQGATCVGWTRDDAEVVVDYPGSGMQILRPSNSDIEERTISLGDVTSLVTSPRGDEVAMACRTGYLAGRLLKSQYSDWKISPPEVPFRPMAFSLQGQFLAIAWTRDTIAILDARTGETFLGPADKIPHRVAWSADGKTIYATPSRNEVHSFEAATGRHLGGWTAPGSRCIGLSIRKDGAILAATTGGAFLHVRDLATARDLVHESFLGTPIFAELSADGSTFAWAQDKSLHSRDLYSGEALPDIKLMDKPGTLFMALNAHGDAFMQGQVTSDRQKVIYTDLYSGRSVLEGKMPTEWSPKCAALSQDGSLSAFQGAYSAICICATGRIYPILCDAADRCDKCLAFSPNGRFLAAAGNGCFIFDTHSGRQVAVITGASFVALAWSPDGKRLAGIDDMGETRIWSVPAPRRSSVPTTNALADWGDMVCQRTDRSFQAMDRLESGGDESVALLREKLAEKENPKQIESLLDLLGSEDYGSREAARQELLWMGVQAEPAILKRMAGLDDGPARHELEALLRAAECRVSGSQQNLRRQRAMQVLEGIGSAESLDVLKQMSANSPSPRERADAEEAVQRLESKRAPK